MSLRVSLSALLTATIVASAIAAGCTASTGSTSGTADDPAAPVATPTEPTVPTETPDPEACAGPDVISLVKTEWEGEPTALYAPVTVNGRSGLLHLDSASAYTVLFASDASGWVDGYGTAKIGCTEALLPGYGGLGTMPNVEGKPVVGMMGADWLRSEPSLVDVVGAKLTRRPSDLSLVEDGFVQPHEVVLGEYVLQATFDGTPVQVVLDTGAAHTVYVDATPRPNETKVETVDALGQPLVLYQSTVVLGLAGHTKQVTLLRAPKFDILEYTSQQMGRKIDGLVGLSAMRALYVDAAKGVLRLGF